MKSTINTTKQRAFKTGDLVYHTLTDAIILVTSIRKSIFSGIVLKKSNNDLQIGYKGTMFDANYCNLFDGELILSNEPNDILDWRKPQLITSTFSDTIIWLYIEDNSNNTFDGIIIGDIRPDCNKVGSYINYINKKDSKLFTGTITLSND